MDIEEITRHELVLREFRRDSELMNELTPVDRPEVVAHATLSALIHHWPSRADAEIGQLLAATVEIRHREANRWMTQRRLAVAKLARLFASTEATRRRRRLF